MRDIQLRELTELKNEIGRNKVNMSSDWNNIFDMVQGYITIVFKTPAGQKKIELDVYKGLETIEFVISELPPVEFLFKLPYNYPKSKPFFGIKSYWMTEEQSRAVLRELNRICEERKNIPTMIGACYKKFKTMVENWRLTKIKACFELFQRDFPFHTYEDFVDILIDEREHPEIDISTIELVKCCICFENQRVENIQVFEPCYHYFCKSCVKFRFKSTVNEHLVKERKLGILTCLAENCSCEASQSVITQLYDQLMLEKSISIKNNSVHCLNEKRNELVFNTSQDEKKRMIEIWENGTENDKYKLCKENGGLNNVKKMIESFKNEFWITTHTKPCPNCRTNIEKGVGRNIMKCGKCLTEFCGLCVQKLYPPTYQHYKFGKYTNKCYLDNSPENYSDEKANGEGNHPA